MIVSSKIIIGLVILASITSAIFIVPVILNDLLYPSDSGIIIDKDLCILCFKCTEAAKNYDNIDVKVLRDRFKGIKGEPSSVWNGIMLRVTGVEGKIKGIMSRSQNKLADSVLRLMGMEVEEED